jgi:Flp pilus assembly protein protease CpaA
MLIYGNTPKDIKDKIIQNKVIIISLIVSFILGAIIF